MKQSFAKKIYTKHGIAKHIVFEGKRVLHLGCGSSKLPGSIGVDSLSFASVDVVHNLDVLPWPFEDNSVDVFFAHSVLEHIEALPQFFEEAWRVGKNGARIIIAVPYFRSVDAFVDPTHRHFFTSGSLEYFMNVPGPLSGYHYTKHTFSKIGFWYGWPQPSKNILVNAFKKFIQRYPLFYDQYLSLLIPTKLLVWELEIVKE